MYNSHIRRTCRGIQDQDIARLRDIAERELQNRDHPMRVQWQQVAAQVSSVNRTGELIKNLIEANFRDAAVMVDRVMRKGCGQDLNPLIALIPFDGQSHRFTCPRCGMEHHATNLIVGDENG